MDTEKKPTLLDLRIERNWSQQIIADLAGVSVPTYSNAEKGRPTSLSALIDICRAYGHSINDIADLVPSTRAYVRKKKVG